VSYSTVVDIQASRSLMDRCTASVATEVSAGSVEGDSALAASWVGRRSWDIASTPSWDDKWESAEASGITDPGASDSVITDADILSRIQQLLATYPLDDSLLPPV